VLRKGIIMAGTWLLRIYFKNTFNFLYFFPRIPITFKKFCSFLHQQVIVSIGYFNRVKFTKKFLSTVMIFVKYLGSTLKILRVMEILNMKSFTVNILTDLITCGCIIVNYPGINPHITHQASIMFLSFTV